jgi:thioredoxin-like negative regulator of GroEL
MKILFSLLIFIILTTSVSAKELIVLGADWCPSCVNLKKFLQLNPKEIKYLTSIQIVDIDKDPDLKKQLKVRVVPTSFIFDDDGKIQDRKEGFSESSYKSWLNTNRK